MSSVITVQLELTLENLGAIYGFLDPDKHLDDKLLQFCDENASKIVTKECYDKLPDSLIKILVKRDTFEVPEIKIFEMLYDLDGRRDGSFEESFEHLRLNQISVEDFAKIVRDSSIYSDDEYFTAVCKEKKPRLRVEEITEEKTDPSPDDKYCDSNNEDIQKQTNQVTEEKTNLVPGVKSSDSNNGDGQEQADQVKVTSTTPLDKYRSTTFESNAIGWDPNGYMTDPLTSSTGAISSMYGPNNQFITGYQASHYRFVNPYAPQQVIPTTPVPNTYHGYQTSKMSTQQNMPRYYNSYQNSKPIQQVLTNRVVTKPLRQQPRQRSTDFNQRDVA